MLKIGIVKWRGKCSKHPGYDPYLDGPGAIRGGCTRCEALTEIQACHQRMLALMRQFAPPDPKRSAAKKQGDAHLQESLFEEL
ncbi:MAG: hypothetical protein JWN34_5823 [Bryobacterales bacterium]|jgi:hypothetical protein|nr:hypothetical protein [Bryobacterales bacterium]